MDTRVDSLKATSQKVLHKTGEFLGRKIAGAVTNLYDDKIVKKKTVEEITILLKKEK